MKIPVYTLQNNEQYYNTQLSQTLQNGLSDSGWTQPPQTSEQIDAVFDDMPDGTTWYDTDRKKFVAKEDGTLVAVSTTPV